jgi:hypothetical protein
VPFEDLDGRGLARSVVAQERDDLAMLDIQVDPVDRGPVAVELHEVSNFDRRHCPSRIRPPSSAVDASDAADRHSLAGPPPRARGKTGATRDDSGASATG